MRNVRGRILSSSQVSVTAALSVTAAPPFTALHPLSYTPRAPPTSRRRAADAPPLSAALGTRDLTKRWRAPPRPAGSAPVKLSPQPRHVPRRRAALLLGPPVRLLLSRCRRRLPPARLIGRRLQVPHPLSQRLRLPPPRHHSSLQQVPAAPLISSASAGGTTHLFSKCRRHHSSRRYSLLDGGGTTGSGGAGSTFISPTLLAWPL
jgi:hypothetical protein